MKKQKKQDKSLAVRREVVRFLGSNTGAVAGGFCITTQNNCTCTHYTQSGCTNSEEISY